MASLNNGSTLAASGELAWEPDDAWKKALKERLDAEVAAKVEQATQEYFRRSEPDLTTFHQHNETIKKICKDAEESYNAGVERERQELRRWAISKGQWDLLATFSAKPDPIVLPPVSPNVLIPIDEGISPNALLPCPAPPKSLFSGASTPALKVPTRDATGEAISLVLGTLWDRGPEENAGANPIPASPSMDLTKPSPNSDAQQVSGVAPVLSPSVGEEQLSPHERSLDRREVVVVSLEEASCGVSAILREKDELRERERREKLDLVSGAEHEGKHAARGAGTDPLRQPLTVYEQGSASRTTEERLPIVGAGTSPPPAQASVSQAESRAPEPQIIPQVVELSDGDASDRNGTPSIHTPDDDPSTNPSAPSLALHSGEPDSKYAPHGPVGRIPGDEHDDIIMPTPVNVGHPKSIQEAASARRIATRGAAPYGFDTGESPPPPPRSGSPGSILYLQPPAYHDHVTISPSVSEGVPMDCGVMPSRLVYPPGQGPSRRRMASPSEQVEASGGDSQVRAGWAAPFRPNSSYQQRTLTPARPPLQNDRPFHAHGWVECILPDENLYYVHQVYQVVTDVDMGDEKILDAVMAYLEDHGDVIPPGQELWLQNMGSRGGGFVPLRCLIDHSKQVVVLDSSHEADGEPHHARHGDDRLDAKYRYWSFMEAHPAHTSLPSDACQEAMDALCWASTNELLPSHLSTPTPFTREECQTLTLLLQSIDRRGETPLRTHTVSKILLRVVRWRRSHFRSDKPLPVDAVRGGPHREDHAVPARSSALMLAVGVCACLSAAITLGPSKPLVRIAGMGGLLVLLPSVVSNVMAIAQSKANDDSMVLHGRRDTDLLSRKGDTTTASPPWHMRLWQGLEFPLYIATSGSSDVIPTTII